MNHNSVRPIAEGRPPYTLFIEVDGFILTEGDRLVADGTNIGTDGNVVTSLASHTPRNGGDFSLNVVCQVDSEEPDL